MLKITLDEENRIVTLEPDGPLSESDFESARNIIDPFIEDGGDLRGLMIYSESFPGWDSFKGLQSHLSFVRDHHKQLRRVALVTDSVISNLGETIASHFVSAEIKGFPYADLEQARQWILAD